MKEVYFNNVINILWSILIPGFQGDLNLFFILYNRCIIDGNLNLIFIFYKRLSIINGNIMLYFGKRLLPGWKYLRVYDS